MKIIDEISYFHMILVWLFYNLIKKFVKFNLNYDLGYSQK